MGIEPIAGYLQGTLASLDHASPICRGPAGSRTQTTTLPRWCAAVTPQDPKLRRRDLNPRISAYETVLEPDSSPLRRSILPAGLEPAILSL
jgi:hypothetical protein